MQDDVITRRALLAAEVISMQNDDVIINNVRSPVRSNVRSPVRSSVRSNVRPPVRSHQVSV